MAAVAASAAALATPPQRTDTDHDYPLAGETLGLWRLVRGVGRGGMGEVYEAEYDYLNLLSLRYGPESREAIRLELRSLSRVDQARLASEMLGAPLPHDARFAIKACSARSGTPGHKRFLQEAEVAQRLGEHPYIVSVHAVNGGLPPLLGARHDLRVDLERGKHKDVAFMVMDLASRTFDHTKLEIEEAVHVVRCIATALDHAHSHGIIHRDLKPENLLGSIQHPLLTDFGIAKELDQTEGLTRTGQIIGTLDYMSPEQATDAKRVDHRSDIYSLGVVLYEMSTRGCLPYFHKQDRESCLAAIRSERSEPKWPREQCPGFPIGLERVILKALAHRMEDRYQAMSEFIGDLDRVARGDSLSMFGRISPRRWLRFQFRRHPRLIWGSVAGCVLVALAVLALILPDLLDQHRRDLDNDLDWLEKNVVARIEARLECQPSATDGTRIKDLDKRLSSFEKERYPEQRQRRAALQGRLLSSRSLLARFAAVSGGTPIATDEAIAAKDQLQLAVSGTDPGLWDLRATGLHLQEDARLQFGPYGAGTVYIKLEARTGPGFALRISESADPRHVSVWRVRDGWLELWWREDEKPEELISRQPFGDGRNATIAIAMEASADGVRSWWGAQRIDDPARRGLTAGASAEMVLLLPKGSDLQTLEIWPQAGPK